MRKLEDGEELKSYRECVPCLAFLQSPLHVSQSRRSQDSSQAPTSLTR